jgi:hypothetical protein
VITGIWSADGCPMCLETLPAVLVICEDGEGAADSGIAQGQAGCTVRGLVRVACQVAACRAQRGHVTTGCCSPVSAALGGGDSPSPPPSFHDVIVTGDVQSATIQSHQPSSTPTGKVPSCNTVGRLQARWSLGQLPGCMGCCQEEAASHQQDDCWHEACPHACSAGALCTTTCRCVDAKELLKSAQGADW